MLVSNSLLTGDGSVGENMVIVIVCSGEKVFEGNYGVVDKF